MNENYFLVFLFMSVVNFILVSAVFKICEQFKDKKEFIIGFSIISGGIITGLSAIVFYFMT